MAHPAQAEGQANEPDFTSLLNRYRQDLGALASDAQALAFFSSHLGPALNVKDIPPVGKSESRSRPRLDQAERTERVSEAAEGSVQAEWVTASLRLAGELAAWNLAADLREAAGKEPQTLRSLVRDKDAQRSWLTATKPPHERLHRALLLAEVLTSFAQTGQPAGDLPGFHEYAAGLDRAMPLTGAENSWSFLAERAGASGLRQRLRVGASLTSGEQDEERLAQAYFETRLRPVLAAQLTALTLLAETDAERGSREAWLQLRSWRDRQREAKGLARLCGTWQWTIHNHQNHQDHKMVMVFDPPPPPTPPSAPVQGMKPAKIVVLGEGVYLRWESAGGYQEDSLLFTGEGQRLEGSFMNSAGAWGSITGKRMGACPTGK